MNSFFAERLPTLPQIVLSFSLLAALSAVQAAPPATLLFSDNLLIINGQVVSGGDSAGMGIKGNGKVRGEVRPVADFQEVLIEMAADVVYRPGSQHEITLSGESNLLPLIKTDVNSGTLRIYASESFYATKALRLTIHSAHLARLVQQGAGDLMIHDLQESQFSLDIEGQSDAVISGEVKRFDLKVSGSGDVDAERLRAQDCAFSLLGSSDISAYCSKSVTGSLMGASDIEIYGSPKKRALKTVGAGDIDYR